MEHISEYVVLIWMSNEWAILYMNYAFITQENSQHLWEKSWWNLTEEMYEEYKLDINWLQLIETSFLLLFLQRCVSNDGSKVKAVRCFAS